MPDAGHVDAGENSLRHTLPSGSVVFVKYFAVLST